MAKKHRASLSEESSDETEQFSPDTEREFEDKNDSESVESFDADAETSDTAETAPTSAEAEQPSQSKFQRFKQWFGRHKKLTIPGTILLLLLILAAVPFTRYALAGLVLKQTFVVNVLDAETNKPVSSADVTLAGKKVQTNGEGRAEIKVRVGSSKLVVEKPYYEKTEQKVLVPIAKQKQPAEVKFKATGRQVPITVINKITKKPLENAAITALDTKASTDKDGKAVLVLPADQQSVEAVFAADQYNETKQALTVTADEGVNSVALTPAGNVYFLSDRSGTLDVVKTNLDGGDRKVVVPGTGKEDKPFTVLLASRDWKYLALLSKRDGGEYAKLFLIDTAADKMIVMDEGTANFELTGWNDHRFVYKVSRDKVQLWQPNREALKSYDADSKKITTLDQTGGMGDQGFYSFDQFGAIYILKNEIVYTKSWSFGYAPGNTYAWQWSPPVQQWVKDVRGRKAEVRTIKADGSASRTVKGYGVPTDNSPTAAPLTTRLYARAYEPQSLWLLTQTNGLPDQTFEEYEDGQIKSVTGHSADDFWQKAYPTFLVSPDGQKTFWSDTRDGKNTLFTGNDKGESETEVARLTDYNSYGWYTDHYLLVSQKGSELYIMPAAGGEALKLTDYYKPRLSYEGYGYGYGGL